jgi:putative colanic acid biosynthesis acetyltransferase WcaF
MEVYDFDRVIKETVIARELIFMSGIRKVDMSLYERASGRGEQLIRLVWCVVWTVLVRPIPRSLLNGWKVFLLRCFGAKIHKKVTVYSGANIYAPWNLEMGAYSCIASGVNCYNADKVIIGAHVVISQKSHLCTASHDISSRKHKWISAPIVVEDQAWIGAESFVMMGVTIGEGAVIGARAAVFKNVEPWTVVGGNPAGFIKKREIIN